MICIRFIIQSNEFCILTCTKLRTTIEERQTIDF